jgi:Ca2+/Na+ antiporter
VINLFIVPLVISLIWILINRFLIKQISTTYGFSGIVSSIAGMVIYGCILYLHKKINIDILNACYSLLTFAALLLTLNYSSLKENLLAIIFLFAIFLFELYQTMKSINRKSKEKFVTELSEKAEVCLLKISKRLGILFYFVKLVADFIVEVSLFLVYLVAAFILAFLFPNTFIYGSTLVNLPIHYLGFVIGIAIFYLVSRH